MQQPTVGRIVHFIPDPKDFPGQPTVAAIVTAVASANFVDLTLFLRGREPVFRSGVPARTTPTQTNVWDWPPRI